MVIENLVGFYQTAKISLCPLKSLTIDVVHTIYGAILDSGLLGHFILRWLWINGISTVYVNTSAPIKCKYSATYRKLTQKNIYTFDTLNIFLFDLIVHYIYLYLYKPSSNYLPLQTTPTTRNIKMNLIHWYFGFTFTKALGLWGFTCS